jgi:hypothetical protein
MTHITRLPRAVGFDQAANEVEDAIGELTRREHRTAYPAESKRSLPLPEYVEHRELVSDVGRLSAQAVAAEYESAAIDVEKLAQGLIEMSAKCSEDTNMVIKHHDMVRAKIEEQVNACMAAAQLYRDEAKAAFDKIQTQSLLIDDARRTLQQTLARVKSGQPMVETDANQAKP